MSNNFKLVFSEEFKNQSNEAKFRGNEYYSKQEWISAISEYTTAIMLNDQNHLFYSNRSACFSQIGQYKEALIDAQKCIELKPDFTKVFISVELLL